MLMTADELKKLVETDESDLKLSMRLSAIEQSIRSYTNNSFIVRGTLQKASVLGGVLTAEADDFGKGDTIELFYTEKSDGLYIVEEVISPCMYRLSPECPDAEGKVALVKYPDDVKFGAAMMIEHDISREGCDGVASETISRHSVTYATATEGNTIMGYPMKLTSFLKPYRRIRR